MLCLLTTSVDNVLFLLFSANEVIIMNSQLGDRLLVTKTDELIAAFGPDAQDTQTGIRLDT